MVAGGTRLRLGPDRSTYPLTPVWRVILVSDQRDAHLGRVALLLAAACAVVVAATVLALALPALWERLRGEGSSVAYSEGEVIDLDPATYRSATSTVFLFSRFSCGACEASKPVMAGIVADLMTQSGVQVVLVTGEALPEEERLFASDLGLDGSHVHHTDLRRLRLRQVPTMVLTDRSGKILMTREGRLTETDRSEVVRMSIEALPTQP